MQKPQSLGLMVRAVVAVAMIVIIGACALMPYLLKNPTPAKVPNNPTLGKGQKNLPHPIMQMILPNLMVRTNSTLGEVQRKLPPLWKGIPIRQLLRIHKSTKPHSDFNKMSTLGVCSIHTPPDPANQTRDPPNPLQQLGIPETFHTVQPRPSDQAAITRAHTWLNQSLERRDRYARFAPRMTAKEKAQLLLTWRVLHRTLTLHNISHYVRAGTQIGALRHGGLIPWDDDMDVAVHKNDAWRLRRVLSCVPGYTLRPTRGKVWKFFADEAPVVPFGKPRFLHPRDLKKKRKEWHYARSVVFRWPCVDLFLMTSDGSFTWCTSRLYLKACVYSLKDVFPLTTLEFEGMRVPAPGRSLSIVKRIVTDKNLCQSAKFDHKKRVGKSVTMVPCEELAPMYTMYPLV